jgi:putative endonuclease
MNLRLLRRGGRAVDCAGLENRKAERSREFESHPLRPASRLRALRRIGRIACAKQDALRSSSEAGRVVYYVNLIESLAARRKRYVGMTSDLKQRLKEHDEGKSPHTFKFRPWKLITYIAFTHRAKAEAFERYLKSGSGQAFANKRLW